MKKTVFLRLGIALGLLTVGNFGTVSAFDPVSSPTPAHLGKTIPGFVLNFSNTQDHMALPTYSYNSCNYISYRFNVTNPSGTLVGFDDFMYDNWNSAGTFNVLPSTYGADGNYRLVRIDRHNYYGYCNNPRDQSVLLAVNTDSGKTLRLPSLNSFVAGDLVVSTTALTLEYHQILEDEDGMLFLQHLSSVPKPTVSASTDGMFDAISNAWDSFWNPESVAFQDPATTPVYLEFRGGSHGWTYKGADGNTYWLRVNADKYFRSAVPEVPVLSVVLDGNETLLASDTGSLGVAGYRNVSGNNLSKINVRNYGSGSHLSYVTLVADPYVYFADQYANVFRWDVRCKTPGYDSCRLDVANSAYYCADSDGNVSPGAEVCGLSDPVGLNGSAPVGDPPSSGSGSSGSGSDSGSGSSGSSGSAGTPSTVSGSTVSSSKEPQNCVPSFFSGSTTYQTSEPNLDPSTCSFRSANGRFACQDLAGHLCVSNGDACYGQILDPAQYATSTPVYSGDVTRYSCSVSSVSCSWSSVSSCGPSATCYADGAYCRVKPEYVPDVVVRNGETQSGSVKIPDVSVPGDLNVGGVSGVGTIGSGGASLSGGSVGTSYPSPVLVGSGTKYCEMFQSGSFIYAGNGSGYVLGFDFKSLSTNKLVKEYLLSYLDKAQTVVLYPFNKILGFQNAISTVPDGAKVCWFGTVYQITYQSTIPTNYRVLPGFTDLEEYAPHRGVEDWPDYLVIFISTVVCLVAIYLCLPNRS